MSLQFTVYVSLHLFVRLFVIVNNRSTIYSFYITAIGLVFTNTRLDFSQINTKTSAVNT